MSKVTVEIKNDLLNLIKKDCKNDKRTFQAQLEIILETHYQNKADEQAFNAPISIPKGYESVWQTGFSAYYQNGIINPYQCDTKEYQVWEMGYQDAFNAHNPD